MLDSNTVILTADDGQEYEMQVILTFEDEDTNKSYALLQDPNDNDGNVFAYTYDDEGNMDAVTSEEEFNMCAEVLGAFQEENEDEEV